MSSVEVRDLAVTYAGVGRDVRALSALTLDVADGELLVGGEAVR